MGCEATTVSLGRAHGPACVLMLTGHATVLDASAAPQVAKAKLQQKTDVEAATPAGARALEGAHAVVRHRRSS